MKKKLEDTYNPEKNARREKVVLGLFGLDSLVTAYLLKIQKYEVIAVTLVTNWDEYTGDQSGLLSCHVTPNRIDALKDFCMRLGIPHQVVKIASEFKEYVIEPWMADRIEGRRPRSCWSCHDLRMKILHQKMKETQSQFLATGHYAKLFHHEGHKTVFVHTSNDEQNDQSALLSRLPHDVLDALMLPLSDLTKKEVLKLAENFAIPETSRKVRFNDCLKFNNEIGDIIQKKVPKKFIMEGDIMGPDGTLTLGQHPGIYNFTLGEPIELRENGRPIKGVFGEYSYPEKKMVIVDEGYFLRNKIMLVNCRLSEEVAWPEPLKAFLVLKDQTMIECWIHPKTLASVSLELTEKVRLFPGEVVSLVKKKGKNAKLFLTGEVQLISEDTSEEEEGEQNVPKIDPVLDF